MQPEESSLSKSLLQTEWAILLILTATVYTAFLVREMGYAEHFSIPQDLIATSHIGLISAAKALLWGVIAYIGKVNIVWMFAPRGDRLLPFVLRLIIGVVLIIGFAMYPYLITGLSWWWFVGLIGVIVFFFFVWPLITQKNIAGYENKIAEQHQIDSQSISIYDLLFARFDKTTIITLSFLVAIIFFAYGDGRRSAIEQEEFNIMDDNPNFIVLRIYGDTIISASFDYQTHQLDGLVTVAKLSEDKVLGIRRTSLGRLKIKKKVILNKTQLNFI